MKKAGYREECVRGHNRKQPGIILISRALDRNHGSCKKWFGQERTPVLAPKSFHQNDRGVEPQERVETLEETLGPRRFPLNPESVFFDWGRFKCMGAPTWKLRKAKEIREKTK